MMIGRDFPGAELVREGLKDLAEGVVSEAALLLLVAKPRLVALGIAIQDDGISVEWPPQHALHGLLEERYGPDDYSRYNSLRRRIVSFTHALEREESARLGLERGECDS